MTADEYILGLDIGGTKTAVVHGDRSGRIHDRVEFATRPARGFEATFDELCHHIDTIRSRAPTHAASASHISVSIGGPLDITRGIIYSPPNLPDWDAIPLKQLLSQRFDLPVYIQHDGNAGALAEWYFGAARGARNVIFLTMGTGFGGGLILDGQLYRGTNDLAGEVGHLRIAGDGPLAYGKAGSWEGFCSGAGIAKLATRMFPQRWPEPHTSARLLVVLAQADDTDAQAVFHEAGRRLGQGLALLVDILNPELIVIGSLGVRLGELVLAPAREALRKEALPRAVQVCRVVPAALGEQLGDVAALCAALEARGGRMPAVDDDAAH